MTTPRCRILHLTWAGGLGGIERVVESLVTLAGDDHRALFLDGSGPIGDRLVGQGRADRLGLRRGGDPRGLHRVARAVAQLRPDIVHVHTHAVGPLVAARAARAAARWVYQEHSPRVLGRDAKFRLLYALLPRLGARFLAPAEAIAAAMRRRLPSGAQVTVLPNPCAVPVTGVADRPSGSPPVVGVVARLAPDKRIDLFLDTLARLRADGLECRGLVIGDGPERARLEAHRDRLGLADAVEFAGGRLDTTTPLDRMDVFLATSALESFGIATVEAMARGVPVVALPCVGGQDDHVRRGGILLEERGVEAAAREVGRLLGSTVLRRDCRARGYVVAAECRPEAVLPRLEAIYAEVVAGRRSGSRSEALRPGP